jgi:hypothetical protein
MKKVILPAYENINGKYYPIHIKIEFKSGKLSISGVVGARRSLGGGYYGYAVSTPKGGTVICEETSGAIIGNSLEAVRNDIKVGNLDVMKQQVTHACNELKKATIVPRDNFWDIYCK